MVIQKISLLGTKSKTFIFSHVLKRRLVQSKRGSSQEHLNLQDVCSSQPYLEVLPTWPTNECPETRSSVLRDMLVQEDFLSEADEESIMKEVDPYLKKLRYEFDHWDDAIHGFRETERSQWNDKNQAIIGRVREFAFPKSSAALQHVHVLDLAPQGHIKPHVDSIRFCGSVIAGLCLLSDAVMRLARSEKPNLAVDVLLKRRCLYIIKDTARYDFTHEILTQDLSSFRNIQVPRTRRISVICRSTPDPTRV